MNSQVENILGDTILLAASIVYLGPFSPEDRMNLRQTLIDIWSRNNKRIKCTENMWNPVRLTSQSKEPTSIFRRIIKDFGLFNLL